MKKRGRSTLVTIQEEGKSGVSRKVGEENEETATRASDYWTTHIKTAAPAPQSILVGGRLQHFWQVWKEEGASNFVGQILWEGQKLRFNLKPPMSMMPVWMESHTEDKTKYKAVQNSVVELKLKGVLEPVALPYSPGFYGHLFLRPKSNGKWQAILDLSSLNFFILDFSYGNGSYYSGISKTRVVGHKNRPIGLLLSHPYSCKIIAARIFTKVVLELVKKIRRETIHIHCYLDNWIVKHTRRWLLKIHSQFTVRLTKRLGWVINFPKSILEPTQKLTYVGVESHFPLGKAFAPEERLTRVKILIDTIIRNKGASARAWSALLG